MGSRTFILTSLTALTVGLVTANASPVSAQTIELPRARQGYYLSFGMQAAASKTWDKGEPVGTGVGSGTTLRLGQMLTQRFGLGLQIHSAQTTYTDHVDGLFGLGLEAQWEFHKNLALRGGSGLAVISLQDKSGGKTRTSGAYSAGYFLGVSYDWFPRWGRLTGGWGITPVLQAHLAPNKDATAFVGILGLEITYWTGLPRNQLQLPDNEAYKKAP